MKNYMIPLSAFSAGILLTIAINTFNFSFFKWVYDKVGITILVLVPLMIWGVWVAFQKCNNKKDLTLSYIAVTAQRVGLLGTVIGVVAATINMGQKLGTGALDAVSGALPAVGQALVSTAVGFLIALACDFFIYLNQK